MLHPASSAEQDIDPPHSSKQLLSGALLGGPIVHLIHLLTATWAVSIFCPTMDNVAIYILESLFGTEDPFQH